MKHDENLNKQPHWRCRLCGHSTPLDRSVCSNPSCRADLGIYGEAVTPGQEDDDRRTWKPREEEETQRSREEAQRQKAEEQRQRAEEKARAKADGQTGQSGSGAPKWLVPALAAALVAVLGIGASMFFTGRGTAGTPVPSQNSDGPGFNSMQPEESSAPNPSESQPGQGESPAADAWKGNVLMSDRPGLDERSKYPAFGGKFERQEIRSITFMDSLDDMHGTQWDVSRNQDGSVMAWADLDGGTKLYDLYIGGTGGVEAPADCSHMFDSYINVERISFNGAFHTDHVTDMSCMLNFCSSLTELDVSGFDTSHVTDMFAMFHNCSSMAELDVSGFDTSNVTDMSSMFNDCSSLAEVDIANFKTSNVADMSYMFEGCRGLRELDVTSFDTSNVTDMSYMFNGCSGLAELDITNFKTSNVTDMSYMFAGVNSGFALHFVRENFDTSSVTDNEGFMSDSFDWRKIFE